jgi:hypothetical protein
MTSRVHSIATRATTTVAVVALVCACVIDVASASAAPPKVKIEVGFSPDRPGAQTTVKLGFTVQASPPAFVPPPVTRTEILLPAGMGLGTTDLGEAICTEQILKVLGVGGCPPNSFMGLGHALVETAVGTELLQEHVQVAILMAQAENEHTTVLYQAVGSTPVSSEVVFKGEMLTAAPPYGARVVTSVPLGTAWPDGPYVALTHMLTTLGPQGLTYYKRHNGIRTSYRPQGMVLPAACPQGGYPFAAIFTFVGEEQASATASVPCDPRHHVSARRPK